MIKVEDVMTFKRAGRNPVAKAVRRPEFRTRVVPAIKQYNRAKEKFSLNVCFE
jgi:hypothetical protein